MEGGHGYDRPLRFGEMPMNTTFMSLREKLLNWCATSITGGAMLVLLLAAVALLGWSAHGIISPAFSSLTNDPFKRIRTQTIQSQLDQIDGDHLIIMGDSHAERLYLTSFCGLGVINAGISGATIRDILELVQTVTPRRKAKRLVLIVGTNDIWFKRLARNDEAEGAFQSDLGDLLDRLGPWAERVTLVGIPPVAKNLEAEFPRAAAARFSATMQSICRAGRCDFATPFSAAQDADGNGPGVSGDGVHLNGYASYFRAQEAVLCRLP